MKKTNKIKMLSLSSLLLLVSCTSQTVKRDKLVFYVWGDSTEVANYEKIARDFKEETGIEIDVQCATGDYYDGLNISFSSANNAPDIFFTESGEFLSHLASKKILNLSPYIESKALDVKTTENVDGKIELWDINDAYRYDKNQVGRGDYYALIKDWSPDFILWYNKSHIDQYNKENNFSLGDEGYMNYPSQEIPMTWSEFLNMSYLLRKENRYGTMLDRVPYKHLMELIQMTGSSTWDENNQYFNADDPNVLKACQFFVDLQIGEKASAPIIGPTGVGSGEAFANGNLSFAFFGNWAYSTYHWDSVGFEIGYCPAPIPDQENITKDSVYATSAGMIALAINSKTTMKDEAVAFLNYYMTKGSEYMARKGFNIPGNKLVANSDAYKNPEESELAAINQYFLKIANDYTHPIVYNHYIGQDTVENIFGKYFSTYLSNPKGSSLETILTSIANDIRREM